MEQDLLKSNLLSIAGAGLLILLTGVILYFYRGELSRNIRFFLPIPPLGVAAYIFVFNMYSHYGGNLSVKPWDTVREVILGTAISAAVFGVFTVLLIIFIGFIKRSF